MAEDIIVATPVTETPTPAPAVSTATTPEPKTFREHYAAESAKAAQSQDQAAAPADGNDTEATQPAEQTQPTGDQPSETVSTEDTLLTAEEVAKLSPKERTLYEKAQKNYTLKTQQLAAQRKELEPFQELIDALKDPARAKDAVTQLAQHVGVMPKAETQTIETTANSMLQGMPEELAFLKPVLEQFGKNLLATIQPQLNTLTTQTNQVVSKAMADATSATLTTFGETHKGWEKHEAKMLDIAKQIQPTGNMSELEYLDVLYKLATHGVQSAEQTKKVVEKLAKSASAAEEVTPGTQAERVEYARPANIAAMSSRERFIAGHEAAKRGQKWV